MPLSLREFLRDEARTKGRSLNTHIIMCLNERRAEGDQATSQK
ncbi:Arc family DNA-binding protein [Sulfitobacter sp. OXR-159]